MVVSNALGDVLVVPLFGADFKSIEEPGWNVNTSMMGGLEWCSRKARRRCRILANYYHSFNPSYGQFFNQKIESFGMGFYLACEARDIERWISNRYARE